MDINEIKIDVESLLKTQIENTIKALELPVSFNVHVTSDQAYDLKTLQPEDLFFVVKRLTGTSLYGNDVLPMMVYCFLMNNYIDYAKQILDTLVNLYNVQTTFYITRQINGSYITFLETTEMPRQSGDVVSTVQQTYEKATTLENFIQIGLGYASTLYFNCTFVVNKNVNGIDISKLTYYYEIPKYLYLSKNITINNTTGIVTDSNGVSLTQNADNTNNWYDEYVSAYRKFDYSLVSSGKQNAQIAVDSSTGIVTGTIGGTAFSLKRSDNNATKWTSDYVEATTKGTSYGNEETKAITFNSETGAVSGDTSLCTVKVVLNPKITFPLYLYQPLAKPTISSPTTTINEIDQSTTETISSFILINTNDSEVTYTAYIEVNADSQGANGTRIAYSTGTIAANSTEKIVVQGSMLGDYTGTYAVYYATFSKEGVGTSEDSIIKIIESSPSYNYFCDVYTSTSGDEVNSYVLSASKVSLYVTENTLTALYNALIVYDSSYASYDLSTTNSIINTTNYTATLKVYTGVTKAVAPTIEVVKEYVSSSSGYNVKVRFKNNDTITSSISYVASGDLTGSDTISGVESGAYTDYVLLGLATTSSASGTITATANNTKGTSDPSTMNWQIGSGVSSPTIVSEAYGDAYTYKFTITNTAGGGTTYYRTSKDGGTTLSDWFNFTTTSSYVTLVNSTYATEVFFVEAYTTLDSTDSAHKTITKTVDGHPQVKPTIGFADYGNTYTKQITITRNSALSSGTTYYRTKKDSGSWSAYSSFTTASASFVISNSTSSAITLYVEAYTVDTDHGVASNSTTIAAKPASTYTITYKCIRNSDSYQIQEFSNDYNAGATVDCTAVGTAHAISGYNFVEASPTTYTNLSENQTCTLTYSVATTSYTLTLYYYINDVLDSSKTATHTITAGTTVYPSDYENSSYGTLSSTTPSDSFTMNANEAITYKYTVALPTLDAIVLNSATLYSDGTLEVSYTNSNSVNASGEFYYQGGAYHTTKTFTTGTHTMTITGVPVASSSCFAGAVSYSGYTDSTTSNTLSYSETTLSTIYFNGSSTVSVGGTASIYISDSSGNAISGLTVSTGSSTTFSISLVSGTQYQLTGISAGTGTLYASATGYTSKSVTITTTAS